MSGRSDIRTWLPILVILLCAFTVPLLRPGIPATHDGEPNIARFAAYRKAFGDGHIPPRWAGELNFGYGSPVFNFFYPLPGYLASVLAGTGLSWETIYKLLIGTAFVSSGLTFYFWSRHSLGSEYAFIGGVLYGLSPFHILNLYIRGDVAELMALALVPLILLGVDRYGQRPSAGTGNFLALTTALLLLSHNGISLLFFPVIVGYIMVSRHHLPAKFAWLGFGLLLAAWFWLPAVRELKYTHASLFIGDMYRNHFLSPLQIIWSPWGFGPQVAAPGGLSPQLGIAAAALICLAVLRAIRTRRRVAAYWFGILLGTLFLVLPVSDPVWRILPLLRNLQFPWRIMAVAGFAASVIIATSLPLFGRRMAFFVFLPFIVLTSLPLTLRIPGHVRHPDSYYETYSGATNFHGESSTVWSAGNPSEFPPARIMLVEGAGTLTELDRSTTRHRFTARVSQPAKIVDNTLYYPGWTVTADGQPVPVEFQDPAARGLITFTLPEGTHDVLVQFRETRFRTLANRISLLSFVIWCMIGGIGLARRTLRRRTDI